MPGSLTVESGTTISMTGKNKMQTTYYTCECHSSEHTLRFDYDPIDGELYTTAYLHAYRPWYQRLWLAVKYVFGRNRNFGDFDCWSLNPSDRDRFLALATEFKKFHDKKQS
jgi:hypothetical protein